MVEPPSSPALCHLAKFPSCVEVENDAWPSEARKSEAVEGDFFFSSELPVGRTGFCGL